jgi:hypothetical protein
MSDHMISVNMFKELYDVALNYSNDAFTSISSATLKIYFGAVSIWWTYIVVQYARGKGDLNAIFEHMFIITVISTVLLGFKHSGFRLFYSAFYEPVNALTTGVSEALLKTMPQGGIPHNGDSILSLLWFLEREIDKLIEFQKGMSSAVAWYNISAHILLLLVLIPYLFVWLIFLAYVLNYIFKITAITVLGPIMVALFTFPSMRKYSYAMGKVVLSGALTVIFASVAMGFTLKLFHTYMALLPVSESGELQSEVVTDFIFSTNFVALFAFGGVSVLFHLKAPVLARAISGVADGPGAEAFVAGIGATMIASSKRMVSRSAGQAFSSIRTTGGDMASNIGQRMKSWVNGGAKIDPTKNNY